jgi:glycosyltransferase involved in cell wall biosynthesis
MSRGLSQKVGTVDEGAEIALVDALPREKLSSLSAFFPAHDEETNVVPMAESLLALLPQVARVWELIIVDDGSRDRTGALADELAAAHPEVRVVHHPVNGGYGAAIRSGFAAARYEYVFFTDGDRQFDPRQIGRLMWQLPRADVIVGYRRNRADNLVRRLNAFAWNVLVHLLFRIPVRDIDCAFKLIPRRALAGYELQAAGAMVSTELLAQIIKHGHRIVEVPVDHFPRESGVSSGGDPRVILRAFAELFRLYRRLRQG